MMLIRQQVCAVGWTWISTTFVFIWHTWLLTYSFFAWGHFCHLLITFANSLDQDQDQPVLIWVQMVWHSDSVSERISKKKISRRQQKHGKLPSMHTPCKELMTRLHWQRQIQASSLKHFYFAKITVTWEEESARHRSSYNVHHEKHLHWLNIQKHSWYLQDKQINVDTFYWMTQAMHMTLVCL